MDYQSLLENDLDEEKAKRSILVTDVPENISPKDVVIHFQKGSNGGGEVVNLEDHGEGHRPSVIITFENPSIVESAIRGRQIIKGKEVTVQRCPVTTMIPEIFIEVQARINRDVFRDGSGSSLKQVLRSLRSDLGIECCKIRSHEYTICGTFKQIILSHEYILDEIRNHKSSQQMPPPGSAHFDVAVEASPEEMGATSSDKKVEAMIFQSVPIILEFIFTVPKYRKRIRDIMSKFNVNIKGEGGGLKVVITPLPGCTRKQHDDACEEYIELYREIYDGPMMSKDIVMRPGSGSSYSAEDVVTEVLQLQPIVIQKMDEQDKWLFYGEETNVRSAINEVCKMLNLDNPLRKTRKAKVRHVSVDKGENNTDDAYSNIPSGNYETGEYRNMKSPVLKDVPDDTEQHFVIKTKRGFRMTVCQGDITQESADVIVNSTDKYLSFDSGLPAAIVRHGGSAIREEAKSERMMKSPKPGDVVITKSGKLSCSIIMHILTNKYKEGTEDCKKLVRDACLDCLTIAQSRNLKSIAFPAVGTGQQRMPLDDCAAAMVSGVEEYMKRSVRNANNDAVADIRFVHWDQTAVEVFKGELKKRYKDSIVTLPGGADSAKRSKHSMSTHPAGKSTGDTNDKKTGKKDEDVCPICLDGFHDPFTLSKCKHKFCKKCIDQAFQHRKVCPTCGMAYGVQTGNMPPGTMNHLFNSSHLPGYERYGTIVINYYFPDGTQGPEHPNPGQWYSGTSRTAYLPNCPEGREVLDLLKKAFNARLTFTIGRSVTTGVSNTVTWNDIHHKTNTYGGATGFGYPDPGYLKRVKDELAAKGIS